MSLGTFRVRGSYWEGVFFKLFFLFFLVKSCQAVVVKHEGGVQMLRGPRVTLLSACAPATFPKLSWIHGYKNTDIPGFQCENSNMERILVHLP